MTKSLILTAIVAQMAILSLPESLKAEGSKVGASSAPALTGRVSSQEEGSMEGVLVTAKKEGARFSITVVSNTQGSYSFPRTRLEPGSYLLGHPRGGATSFMTEAQSGSLPRKRLSTI